MTISMPARRRWPLAVAAAVAGILVGLLIGLAVSGDEDPDPVGAVRDTRAQLDRAASILDVVPIEYGRSVAGGDTQERIRGAEGTVERSQGIYRDARPALSLLDAQAATAIDHGYSRLLAAIRAQRPAAEVNRATARQQALLRGSPGG
jgi:hypothetical protein